MHAHGTYTNSTGHTFTVVEVPYPSTKIAPYFSVQERNELGTFVRHAFSARTKREAEAWCERRQAA